MSAPVNEPSSQSVPVNEPSSQSVPVNEPSSQSVPVNEPSSQSIPVELWRAILLAQLGQCWDDVRQTDSILWQIPAGIGAIVGLVLAAIGANAVRGKPNLVQVIAVFAASAVTFSLIVAVYKNRVFQVSRSIYIKSFYKQLMLTKDAKDGTLVPAFLTFDDYDVDELPGLAALATKDLSEVVQERAAAVSGFRFIGDNLSRLPAFKTLFYVSVFILIGEIAFAIWLIVRL